MGEQVLTFGPFQLMPAERLLLLSGKPLQLDTRMRILIILDTEAVADGAAAALQFAWFVEAYDVFRAASVEIVVASTNGGDPWPGWPRPRPTLATDAYRRFASDRMAQDDLAETLCLDDVYRTTSRGCSASAPQVRSGTDPWEAPRAASPPAASRRARRSSSSRAMPASSAGSARGCSSRPTATTHPRVPRTLCSAPCRPEGAVSRRPARRPPACTRPASARSSAGTPGGRC